MPKVPEYFAPDAMSIIHPSSVGEEAFQRAGRMGEERARVAGSMIAQAISVPGQAITKQIDDYTYQKESLQSDKVTAELAATSVQDFNKAASGFDPDHFGEAANSWLQNWTASAHEKFQAQVGFMNPRAAMRGEEQFRDLQMHMGNIVTSSVATVGGENNVANYAKSNDALNNLVGSDVSSLGHAQGQVDSMHDNLKKTTPPEYWGRLDEAQLRAHEALDKSAFEGILVSNPNAAEQLANKGYFKYLPGGQMAQGIQTAKRLHAEDAERGMVMAKMQQESNSQAALGGWLKNNLVQLPDGTTGLSPDAGKTFLQHAGNMLPSQILEGVNAIRISHDETIKPFDRPEVVSNVQKLVTTGDPTAEAQIDLAVAGKGMTAQTGEEWKQVLHSPFAESLKDPIIHQTYDNAMKSVGIAIVGPTFGSLAALTKTSDQMAFQAAMAHLTTQLSGMSKQEVMKALDPADPASLISATALQRFIALKPTFSKLYGDAQDNGVQAPGVTPSGPAPQTRGRPPLQFMKTPGEQ